MISKSGELQYDTPDIYYLYTAAIELLTVSRWVLKNHCFVGETLSYKWKPHAECLSQDNNIATKSGSDTSQD